MLRVRQGLFREYPRGVLLQMAAGIYRYTPRGPRVHETRLLRRGRKLLLGAKNYF